MLWSDFRDRIILIATCRATCPVTMIRSRPVDTLYQRLRNGLLAVHLIPTTRLGPLDWILSLSVPVEPMAKCMWPIHS